MTEKQTAAMRHAICGGASVFLTQPQLPLSSSQPCVVIYYSETEAQPQRGQRLSEQHSDGSVKPIPDTHQAAAFPRRGVGSLGRVK